jgi:hypothetical protein
MAPIMFSGVNGFDKFMLAVGIQQKPAVDPEFRVSADIETERAKFSFCS